VARVLRDAEVGERPLDRGDGAAIRGAVVGDEARHRRRPGTELRRQRRVVEREEAAMDPAVPFRHRPMRESLIEIPGDEADEGRLDPRVGVDVRDRQQPVTMPDRCRGVRRCWRAGAGRRAETRRPEPAHGSPLVRRAIVGVAEHCPRRSGVRRQIGAEPRESRRLLERPGQLVAGRRRNPVQHHRRPEIEAPSRSGDVFGAARAELRLDQRRHVLRENPSRRELVPVARFREERFASQPHRRTFDRVLERQVLERVERVVVDEDADRALRRQQMRQLVDQPFELQDVIVLRASLRCLHRTYRPAPGHAPAAGARFTTMKVNR
jgi:hypothetical protein